MLEWQASGGDRCLGQHLGALLRQAAFGRVEVRPAYSLSLWWREHLGEFVARAVAGPEFVERFVRPGWSSEQLSTWPPRQQALPPARTSIVALAEYTAIGWRAD